MGWALLKQTLSDLYIWWGTALAEHAQRLLCSEARSYRSERRSPSLNKGAAQVLIAVTKGQGDPLKLGLQLPMETLSLQILQQGLSKKKKTWCFPWNTRELPINPPLWPRWLANALPFRLPAQKQELEAKKSRFTLMEQRCFSCCMIKMHNPVTSFWFISLWNISPWKYVRDLWNIFICCGHW